MRRIHCTLRPPIEEKSYVDWIKKTDQKASVSCRGIIAFTSSFCLNKSRPVSNSYHVYVADTNTPHRPFLITESEHQFTILEWDPFGTQLLVCDVRGHVTIFQSTEYLISDWQPNFKQTLASERFVAAIWYHPGIQSTINLINNTLKNPSNHLEYTEKIQRTKFGASVRLFGGKGAEGCLLLSSTGLVCCLTKFREGSNYEVSTDSLGPLRSYVAVADISHDKDGSFIVGTSAGPINSTIQFHKVTLTAKNLTLDDMDPPLNSPENRRINISIKAHNSFHLNVLSQMIRERANNSSPAFERVAHIKFVTKCSPEDVLVEVKGRNLSLIELWELEAYKAPPVNAVILNIMNKVRQQTENSIMNETQDKNKTTQQSNSTTATTTTTTSDSNRKEWSFRGNYIAEKDLVALQTPNFKLFGSNRQANMILLAYKDNTICCMRKEDLGLMCEPFDISRVIDSDGQARKIEDLNNYSSQSDQLYYNCMLQTNTSSSFLNGSTTKNNIHLSKTTGDPSSNINTNNINNDNNNNNNDPMDVDNMNNSGINNNNDKNNQENTSHIYITDIQFSPNQTVFFSIDTMSQIQAIQLPPPTNWLDEQDFETYLQYSFEYCLVTGNDYWDLIVCTKQQSLDNICDKLHDAYERQPKHLQATYFNRQLTIRASLYRCINNTISQLKASECHTMIMLNYISTSIKSLLRSQNQDSQPGEDLTNLLKSTQVNGSGQQQVNNNTNFLDCNSVMAKLNDKEFAVEINLAQSLQPLIQWVTELAIYWIVSKPQRHKKQQQLDQITTNPLQQQQDNNPSRQLYENRDALESLRELLVIIKIWSQHNEFCQPNIIKLNEQFDLIGTLYKLISINYNQLLNGEKPDENFLDECTRLSHNIAIPQFSFALNPIGVASPLLFEPQKSIKVDQNSQINVISHPNPMAHHHLNGVVDIKRSSSKRTRVGDLILEYFNEVSMPELVNLPKIEGAINVIGDRKIDVIRNISLGAHPVSNMRSCTRCNSVSLTKSMYNSARTWEQRWIRQCVCGGWWAQKGQGFVWAQIRHQTRAFN